MTQNIRIHLADDHQVLIDGLTNLLQTVNNFEVVGNSLDGTTVYQDVSQNNADILVLDISMPKKDGIEVLKEFINHNILPQIFEHGGVGASGDLVQLAHVALCLIGEGEVMYELARKLPDWTVKKETHYAIPTTRPKVQKPPKP